MTPTQAILIAAILAFCPVLILLRISYPRHDTGDDVSDWHGDAGPLDRT